MAGGASRARHNHPVRSLLCFVVGGLVGWGASRGGTRVQQAWPVVLRIQILLTSATLSLVAAWRLTALGQVVGPLVLAGSLWTLLAASVMTRGERSAGQAALESWAVGTNSGFWVVPVATAFAGAAGAMIAVLANTATTAQNAICVHLMRRDAPIRQRRSTTWVDQSPLLALAIGLALHAAGPAPGATANVLTLAGPLLAFSGAALFAGSVVHPHNLSIPKSSHALRRWTWLTALRVGYLLLIVACTSSRALEIVAALSALSAPSFSPIQQAVLYGYRPVWSMRPSAGAGCSSRSGLAWPPSSVGPDVGPDVGPHGGLPTVDYRHNEHYGAYPWSRARPYPRGRRRGLPAPLRWQRHSCRGTGGAPGTPTAMTWRSGLPSAVHSGYAR